MENFSQAPDLGSSPEAPKHEAPKVGTPPVRSTKAPEPGPVQEIHHHCCENKRAGFSIARLLFGGLLILIGLAYLGNSLGWFEVNVDVWQLWPLLIVFLGLSILSRHGWISWIVGIAITLVVLGGVAYVVFVGSPNQRALTTETVTVAQEAVAESAKVDVNTGAGKLTLRGGATDLINGTFESNITTLSKTSTLTGKVQDVSFDMRGGRWSGLRSTNELDLQLQSDLPTEVSVDSGAMDMQFDLTDVKLTKLDVDTGASNLDLELGDKVDLSEVRIKAGASSLSISVPKTVGVKLDVQAGLSSKDLQDFTDLGDGQYESKDYSSATKKITISLDLGVSSLDVSWR